MTREEAIKRLSDIRADYSCFDDDERPKYHALSMAIEALQDDWIPVSERLPEEDVPVLVAVKRKDRLPKWVEKQAYHYVTDIDAWDADGGWYGNKRNVTAWMPLPAPYKESDRE